ncbi:DUF6624 domain-containing protein [Terricaulis sp.]|uniref:DUF6624 domain-containing protein n=1 Tax=Terricaulis sp. TaxID=2768686 RepID=UPI003783838F
MTDWSAKLIAAATHDVETRTRLAQTGALFDGYNPEMEAVHLENAALLEDAIAALGWPGRGKVGEDGAASAFLILQHAISRPDLQRRGLALILDAIAEGEANALDAAYLSDRIDTFEDRPQTFGTQFDWDESGLLSPRPVREPAGLDERRASVGLPPMAETIATMRARAAAEGDRPPGDLATRRARFEEWARRVGWRA